jgi:hypothetical protein
MLKHQVDSLNGDAATEGQVAMKALATARNHRRWKRKTIRRPG